MGNREARPAPDGKKASPEAIDSVVFACCARDQGNSLDMGKGASAQTFRAMLTPGLSVEVNNNEDEEGGDGGGSRDRTGKGGNKGSSRYFRRLLSGQGGDEDKDQAAGNGKEEDDGLTKSERNAKQARSRWQRAKKKLAAASALRKGGANRRRGNRKAQEEQEPMRIETKTRVSTGKGDEINAGIFDELKSHRHSQAAGRDPNMRDSVKPVVKDRDYGKSERGRKINRMIARDSVRLKEADDMASKCDELLGNGPGESGSNSERKKQLEADLAAATGSFQLPVAVE